MWDQVSRSSQSVLVSEVTNCLSSFLFALPSPTAQRLGKAPRDLCSPKNTTGISQLDSPSLKFYQLYLCLRLFETHLRRLKLQ